MENSIRLGIYMLDVLHMSVKGLFGHLNYELDFESNDGFSIIAAPNGFGKSTVLKIIRAVVTGNVFLFASLSFEKVSLRLKDGKTGEEKDFTAERSETRVSLAANGPYDYARKYRVVISYDGCRYEFSNANIENIESNIKKNLKDLKIATPLHEYNHVWKMRGRDAVLDLADVYEKYARSHKNRSLFTEELPWLKDFISKFDRESIYVAENRLVESSAIRSLDNQAYFRANQWGEFTQDSKSKDFSAFCVNLLIREYNKRCYCKTPPLKSVDARDYGKMTKSEIYEMVSAKLQECKERENRYIRFAVYADYPGIQENPVVDFPKAESKLTDCSFNKKSSIETLKKVDGLLDAFLRNYSCYDDFLDRLDLLEKTLNNMFFFKKVRATVWGLYFANDDGLGLASNRLSSGENHMVTLLGSLLFDSVKRDGRQLILMDEPETSLHPAWQRELADFFYKCKVKFNKRFIFASHSPLFIGSRWDNVINLYLQVKGE